MNAVKASRFIFLATKSYYKRFLVPFFMIIIMLFFVSTRSSFAFTGAFGFITLLLLSAILSFYPFYASDKVPQLFTAMPQRRVDFVRGVYLNYIVLILADLIIGLAVLFIFRMAGFSYTGLFFSYGLVFFVFSLIMAVELPIMFKIGYARMQMVFNFVFFAVGFLPAILIDLFHGQSIVLWVIAHREKFDNSLFLVGFMIAAAAVLAVSYTVSLRIYREKDI